MVSFDTIIIFASYTLSIISVGIKIGYHLKKD